MNRLSQQPDSWIVLLLQKHVLPRQGIARPQSRACTILCSDKAIIRCLMAHLCYSRNLDGAFQRRAPSNHDPQPTLIACNLASCISGCIDGAYYFMFRVCDLRSQHALVEPHIRCYCVEQSDIRGGAAQVLEFWNMSVVFVVGWSGHLPRMGILVVSGCCWRTECIKTSRTQLHGPCWVHVWVYVRLDSHASERV